ncbi:MAG: hypothetical protein R2771_15000 [Saprospiraceae bacterium]
MGKNWIHIKDGSEIDGKQADLAISTNETFKMDDMIVIKGVIALKKDLGYGYVYDVLMEDGEKLN